MKLLAKASCGIAQCPAVYKMDDGRLLIVGKDGHAETIKHGIHGPIDERAIIVDFALIAQALATEDGNEEPHS